MTFHGVIDDIIELPPQVDLEQRPVVRLLRLEQLIPPKPPSVLSVVQLVIRRPKDSSRPHPIRICLPERL
jgi:hypothetical protein